MHLDHALSSYTGTEVAPRRGLSLDVLLCSCFGFGLRLYALERRSIEVGSAKHRTLGPFTPLMTLTATAKFRARPAVPERSSETPRNSRPGPNTTLGPPSTSLELLAQQWDRSCGQAMLAVLRTRSNSVALSLNLWILPVACTTIVATLLRSGRLCG